MGWRPDFREAFRKLFEEGIPAYVAYKMGQEEEQKKKKEADRTIKEAEKKARVDVYTELLKDKNPIVRGGAMRELEKVLAITPYSTVVGGEKPTPTGMPGLGAWGGKLAVSGLPGEGGGSPATMPRGPLAGGVMTRRQPSLSEILESAEPETKPEMTPYQTGQLGLGKQRVGIQQETLGLRQSEAQRATDMNVINNYYAQDEQGNFTTPYETAKMLEPQAREASMRQFGRFAPRLPAEKRPTIFRKDLPERLGEPEIRLKGTQPTTNQANRVKVQAPDGTIGTIPADQLEEALKRGYKKVE